MLKIGIIPNEDKDEDLKYTRTLIDSIRKCGGTALYATKSHQRSGIKS